MTASGGAASPAARPPAGYPRAGRLALTENLFGHRVADPYRWLEDPASQPARDWLAAQDVLWLSQAAGLPARDPLAFLAAHTGLSW